MMIRSFSTGIRIIAMENTTISWGYEPGVRIGAIVGENCLEMEKVSRLLSQWGSIWLKASQPGHRKAFQKAGGLL
jgi:hypothetical protein